MNIAIVLAGGVGQLEKSPPVFRPFVDIYGKPLIIHTLELFEFHQEIDQIVVACKEKFINDLVMLVRCHDISKLRHIVCGGATRQQSSFNALNVIKDTVDEDTVVVIHDAVRPLVTGRIISDNIKGARRCGAIDTVIPAEDTIVESSNGEFLEALPKRNEIYIGQTPQSFLFDVIYKAHTSAISENISNASDDCGLILRLGGNVELVRGEKLNFKITNEDDLTLLKALVKLGKLERI